MATSAVSFKIDQAGVNALLRGRNGDVAQGILRMGNRVLNLARRGCPVDEGRLRGSLTCELRMEGGIPVARVGSNLDYLVYVHEGTGIYAGRGMIRPVRASVLRWPVKNNSGAGRRRYRSGRTAAYAYARSVRGVKGRPFLLLALVAARS